MNDYEQIKKIGEMEVVKVTHEDGDQSISLMEGFYTHKMVFFYQSDLPEKFRGSRASEAEAIADCEKLAESMK